MVWIFALGILALAVFHRGFRIFVLWGVGIALVALVCIVGWQAYRVHRAKVAQIKANTTFELKVAMFTHDLRKYCSHGEIEKLKHQGWIPLVVTAGESPADFAQSWHCAGKILPRATTKR